MRLNLMAAAIVLLGVAVAVAIHYAARIPLAVIVGLLAGSMTDPPALSFANQIAASDAPAITYASVYALAMFLRIVTVQVLVLLLA